MKRWVTIALVGSALSFGAMTAVAQQRPTPIPSNTDGTSSHHRPNPLPRAKFPMPASQYELIIGRLVELVRRLSGHRGYTPGDINKAIFDVKNCAANVEADGVVTAAEANYCNSIIEQLSLDNRDPGGGH